MAIDNPQRSVLLIGKSQLVLDDALHLPERPSNASDRAGDREEQEVGQETHHQVDFSPPSRASA